MTTNSTEFTERTEVVTSWRFPLTTKPPNLEVYDLLCRVVMVVILCVTLWMIFSMAVYGTKAGKWKNTQSGRTYIACFVAVTWSVARIVVHLVIFQINDIPGAATYCDFIVGWSYFFGGISVYLTYAFLWWRHRTIYAHGVLRKFQGKFVNIVSWSMLAFLTALVFTLLCGFIIPKSSTASDIGCIFIPSENRTDGSGAWSKMNGPVLAGCMLSAQLILLFLFLNPMVRLRLRRSGNTCAQSGAQDRILAAIRRSIISASLAALTDILVTVLGDLAYAAGYPVSIIHTLPIFDVLINNFCILATFKNFVRILTVIFRWKELHKICPKPCQQNQQNRQEGHFEV